VKITQFRSSTYILESKFKKILFDPWLVNGEYYGSWFQYPEYDLDTNLEKFDVDYICITHIHPDHFSRKTLSKLNKHIPIIILKYSQPFLKKNIEQLGFKVIEIESGKKICIDELDLFYYSADNCDPAICQKIFGCGNFGVNSDKKSSNFIDSLVVVKDNSNSEVLINSNDCLFEMAEIVSKKIQKKFKKVDLLMTGYSGAGAYPQCFENLSTDRKKLEIESKKKKFLNNAINFTNLFKPHYVIPFAGQYELAGKLSEVNEFRGVPDLLEAKKYINEFSKTNCILPLLEISFDIKNISSIKEIQNAFYDARAEYLNKIKNKKLDYEKNNKIINLDDLKKLIQLAFQSFETKRKLLNFSTKTKVFIYLDINCYLLLNFNGEGYSYVKKVPETETKFLILKLDLRLLELILMGPKFAHWNNAELGSHINFYRKPDLLYERGLHFCLNFFHV